MNFSIDFSCMAFRNLVGLGTDGAATLTGSRTGVITRLTSINEHIVLVPCICHSLHKAAEWAFKNLPSHLTVLVRDTYGYFCQSSSRKDRYAEVGVFSASIYW